MDILTITFGAACGLVGTLAGVFGNVMVGKGKNKLDAESQIRKDMIEMNSRLIQRVDILQDQVNKLREERIEFLAKIDSQTREIEELRYIISLRGDR
jgi:uncharacterized coiled-coil DUF342 family protein